MKKPDERGEAEWQDELAQYRRDAFNVTVSITGAAGGAIKYGERDSIFTSDDLPMPISTIYFTNRTAFQRNANGREPRKRFELIIDFVKPPIFDPNPLVSEPTRNVSHVKLYSDNVGFFRASQNIVESVLKLDKSWYAIIHGRFAYDFVLWFIAFPYVLYFITSELDIWLPSDGKYGSYRVAGFIYGIGMASILYRMLFSYLKWAYPVNVLSDNKDASLGHRVIFAGLALTAFSKGIFALAAKVVG